MLGQQVRLHSPQELAHLVHQRPADGVLGGHPLDHLAPRFVAGGQRLAQQILEEEHLHTAPAHGRDKLVVLPLSALDPQHIVEQQVVVIRRGQPLEAELRPVHNHLAQLADFGVNTELFHLNHPF